MSQNGVFAVGFLYLRQAPRNAISATAPRFNLIVLHQTQRNKPL